MIKITEVNYQQYINVFLFHRVVGTIAFLRRRICRVLNRALGDQKVVLSDQNLTLLNNYW